MTGSPPLSSPSSLVQPKNEDLASMPLSPQPIKGRKRLAKHLSITNPRDIAWEKRRRQIFEREQKNHGLDLGDGTLTDEDMNELKGSIELGFGFNEEEGQKLCNTLPALDLYFAVNRLSPSPVSSPQNHRSSSAAASLESPKTGDSDAWKICSPGEDPEQVKAKLKHWAQAVACSLIQSRPFEV